MRYEQIKALKDETLRRLTGIKKLPLRRWHGFMKSQKQFYSGKKKETYVKNANCCGQIKQSKLNVLHFQMVNVMI